MMYYKVKKSADGFRCVQKDKSFWSLISGELYTTLELQKYGIPRNLVEAVSIPNQDTFWSFGARFKSSAAPDLLA